MRKSGILLHISSLPSKYGIGTFGKEAYRFADFLKKTKQSYWQILPLGPTSYGDSPYQTFCAFANNPYFIDLDILVEEELLHLDDVKHLDKEIENINYSELYNTRFKVLRKAFKRFDVLNESFRTFIAENAHWLVDYAMFMTLKFLNDGKAWNEWSAEYRLRNRDALELLKLNKREDIDFWMFIQFKAYEQWYRLKHYVNRLGIEVIGDMPIYVALDSSDAWASPELFQFDGDKKPTHVAGVPPDNFSKDGQLWGNPLYNWTYMKQNNYEWWIKRVESDTKLFDIVRIDHFIGFVNYYAIPYGQKTAKDGTWNKGPGYDLFETIERRLGKKKIIAEDLGVITDEVRAVIKKTQFPSMKLTQFAFDPREVSDYLPFNYEKNTIVYTGTHDNETSKTWFEGLSEESLKYCHDFINDDNPKTQLTSFIKMTLNSVSNQAIIPMQDYLELGADARMNVPSTVGNNWIFRIKQGYDDQELISKISHLTKISGRIPRN